MIYSVKTLPIIYEEVQVKLSIYDQRRFYKLIKQIESNPYVGDSLQIKNIREKRFDGKRIYYVIFDDLRAVLIVAMSDKKTQQKTIDFIRNNLNEYRLLMKKILKS